MTLELEQFSPVRSSLSNSSGLCMTPQDCANALSNARFTPHTGSI